MEESRRQEEAQGSGKVGNWPLGWKEHFQSVAVSLEELFPVRDSPSQVVTEAQLLCEAPL